MFYKWSIWKSDDVHWYDSIDSFTCSPTREKASGWMKARSSALPFLGRFRKRKINKTYLNHSEALHNTLMYTNRFTTSLLFHLSILVYVLVSFLLILVFCFVFGIIIYFCLNTILLKHRIRFQIPYGQSDIYNETIF